MLFTIYPEVNLCYSQYTLRLTYVIHNIPGPTTHGGTYYTRDVKMLPASAVRSC